MATGASLIDRVADDAKMNATAASADRTRILGWLQEAAERACGDAEAFVTFDTSVTLTTGTYAYTLNASPFPTNMMALLEVSVTDASTQLAPVDYVSPTDFQGLRIGGTQTANGTPLYYSGDWPNFQVWPPPAASTTLKITYVANAPTLVDSSTVLTFIPNSFLWGCVFELAMMRAFQYKGNPDAARDRYVAYTNDRNAGLPGLRRWVGGSMSRQGRAHSRLHSAVYSPSQDQGF